MDSCALIETLVRYSETLITWIKKGGRGKSCEVTRVMGKSQVAVSNLSGAFQGSLQGRCTRKMKFHS